MMFSDSSRRVLSMPLIIVKALILAAKELLACLMEPIISRLLILGFGLPSSFSSSYSSTAPTFVTIWYIRCIIFSIRKGMDHEKTSMF